MNQKKYWQSFGERNQSENYQEDIQQEVEQKSFVEVPAKRRDFLKFMGFSTAAALAAASCETPIRRAIPYAIKPEEINPGQASYYATTYLESGNAVPIVAKVRDGRPIKIEGNELSNIYKGGTSARVQASILELYDQSRLKAPLFENKETSIPDILKKLKSSINKDEKIAFVSTTMHSPSSLKLLNEFKSSFPNFEHIYYDSHSYSALIQANEFSYGKPIIPSLHFEKAKVVVGIACDFLGTWLNPIEFSRQYATLRKIDEKNPSLSYHIQFDAIPTITGSVADVRYTLSLSKMKFVLSAILDLLTGNEVKIQDKKTQDIVKFTVEKLKANIGQSLLVCGVNNTDCHIIVNQINNIIQSNGNTINWGTAYNIKKGKDTNLLHFIERMNAGEYGTVIFYDTNPAYNWVDPQKFTQALAKVKNTVSLNPKLDETATLCKFVIPSHHFLESWGDAEPKTGNFSFLQPTINPLFQTIHWQDIFLHLKGSNTKYADYLKEHWMKILGSEEQWFKTLEQGVINDSNNANFVSTPLLKSFDHESMEWHNTENKNNFEINESELVVYYKVGIGSGKGAENPWLQEMPDPVSRATWDNYFIISPQMARRVLKIDLSIPQQADAYEVHPAKKQITITNKAGKSLTLPALIVPGTDENTIGVALGYGRNNTVGKAAEGVGKNAFIFRHLENETIRHNFTSVNVKAVEETYNVAMVQTHFRFDTAQGTRTEVIKVAELESFIVNPNEIRDEREAELKPYGGIENFEKSGTLYGTYDRPGIKWGMNIDMNLCNGCGACVVACVAENNISIVGKEEVMRAHEMQWIRIDKYYYGDLDSPKVVFQPMLCQHCDNAPCENVCPVSATNHSSEGLNQMAYNRCIGTRYCANNCPFKVRRFNWADYTAADSFPDNQRTKINAVVWDMNNDLTRMVLNPDVTVRSRGVIEKCSFCVQRLQEAKLTAKKENRPLADKDIKVACQQACPTQAIVFGNANDKNSAISKVRSENQLRQYKVLEQLHVLPNVTYLAKVSNQEYL